MTNDGQDLAKANPFRYSSYFYDEETKLYYLNARYYSPELGRFLSMDPVPGLETDGISQNKYLYARNNPATLNDPSGLIASPADDMPSDSPYIDRYNTGTDLIARVGVLPVQTAERLNEAANEVANSAFTGAASGVTEVAVGQAVSKLGQVPVAQSITNHASGTYLDAVVLGKFESTVGLGALVMFAMSIYSNFKSYEGIGLLLAIGADAFAMVAFIGVSSWLSAHGVPPALAAGLIGGLTSGGATFVKQRFLRQWLK